MKNTPYKIILSKGESIKIDSDEVKKVLEARMSGKDVKLRRAIFNPSYYVAIIEDEDRKIDYKYQDEVPLLKDSFKDIDLGLNSIQSINNKDIN